ncbi:MAG TPA: ROK family protein [Acidimicrobiales bacterium]|nr:ROK family protein [Acidimicrobiales bacterium]
MSSGPKQQRGAAGPAGAAGAAERHEDGSTALSVAPPRAAAGVAGRPGLMRALNERLLLEHIRSVGRASRAELARTSGLSKPTVALALSTLEHDGLVRPAGLRTGVRGPAAVLYEICQDGAFVLGLDVGREYLRGAIADIAGGVRARASRPASKASARQRVAELLLLADELAAEAGITWRRVAQVVVGSPGVYDPARGALAVAANFPGWESPKVLVDLQRMLGPATFIENDIDLAALAERDMGHGRNVRSFCFVSVGTGIGMGLVIEGRLHRGAHGAAGEIAYLPLAEPEVVSATTARRHGLLEAVASAAAVVRAGRSGGLRRVASARHVFAAAAAGDTAAGAVVAQEARLIARAVSSVVAVVDPELVVLGGGIGRAPGFAEAVSGELGALVPFVPEVRVSALGQDAVVDGCLVLGLEMAWQRILDRT